MEQTGCLVEDFNIEFWSILHRCNDAHLCIFILSSNHLAFSGWLLWPGVWVHSLSYTLRDAHLYALTFPFIEFLPLCKRWAWDKMTPDDVHRSRLGKIESWDVGFCSQHYQSYLVLFGVSVLSSQHVRVSIAPWGERNWEGCSLIIIFQWTQHLEWHDTEHIHVQIHTSCIWTVGQ